MKTSTHIYLFGSLRKNPEGKSKQPVSLPLDRPAALRDIFKKLRISFDRVQLAMVNHRATRKDTMIQPGDRVALFPREYPIFVDWNDFRS